MSDNKVYEPPPDRDIDEYAKKVCKELADKQDNPNINQWDVITGFAGFLKLVARIKVKQLNGKK